VYPFRWLSPCAPGADDKSVGRSGARIHLRFALLSGVAVAVAAAAILTLARGQEVQDAERDVAFHAIYVADAVLVDNVRASDFAGPVSAADRARLDSFMRREVLVGGGVRVKLYGRDGSVTYSNEHDLIGTKSDDVGQIDAALAGRAARGLTYLDEEGGNAPHTKALEVYVPVYLNGGSQPVGVFELYQDYRPVARAVQRALLPLAAVLVLALLGLWAVLFPLVRRTTRALERSLAGRREAEVALESTSEQLRQSQKLDAIGGLAGGVAHDFNNLLLAISGYTEFLVEGLDGDPRLRGYAEEVAKAADRAAGLTQQLLAFSRRQVLQPQVLDLNSAVRDVETMLRRLLEAHVDIELTLDQAVAPIDADPTQVVQVLLNLAVNARDAMAGSGTLTIETRNDRNEVVLRVSDTGLGMDEETRTRVFEPFFTTKPVGEGTGLGLATVYGIVTQSGGTIDVTSALGHGTTFELRFPRSTASVELAPVTPLATARGDEQILVVEDEDSVRDLVCEMLIEQGYRVVAAASAHEALAVDDTWDLLLVDVVMPGMNGVELARRFDRRHVLFMSGYDGQALVAERAPFLQKPFTKDELARKIRAVLDEQRAAA
jgi:two-component system cell cycle sensor histidine kinase/response regulator CckA